MKKIIISALSFLLLFGNVAFASNLTRGSKGDEVLTLQKYLIFKNLLPESKVDGVFGRKTLMGVKEFQRLQGIKQDGIVGDNLIQIINNDISNNPDLKLTLIKTSSNPNLGDQSSGGIRPTPSIVVNTGTASTTGKVDSTSASLFRDSVDYTNFKNWTLSGGATVDSSGVLHLKSFSQIESKAISPFIPLPLGIYGVTVTDGADVYTTGQSSTAAQNDYPQFKGKGSALSGIAYFDSNFQPISNIGNWFSNGSAQPVDLNSWQPVKWFVIPSAPNVAYVKIDIVTNSYFTAPSYDVRNFSLTTSNLSNSAGLSCGPAASTVVPMSTMPTQDLCSITSPWGDPTKSGAGSGTYSAIISVPASSSVNLDKANSVYTWSCGANVCKAPAKLDATTTTSPIIKNVIVQNYSGTNYFVIYGSGFSLKDNIVLINGKENKPLYESSSQINVSIPGDTLNFNLGVVVRNTKTGLTSNTYTVTSITDTLNASKVDTTKKPVITGASGYDTSLTPPNTTTISPNKYLVVYGTFADKDNTLILNGVSYSGNQLAYESNSQINLKLGELLTSAGLNTASFSVKNSNGTSNVYTIGVLFTANGLPVSVSSYATTTTNIPIITGVNGYDTSLSNPVTSKISSNKMMLLYGKFASSGNSVNLSERLGNIIPAVYSASVVGQSERQLNVQIGNIPTSSSSTPRVIYVSVTNAGGTSSPITVELDPTPSLGNNPPAVTGLDPFKSAPASSIACTGTAPACSSSANSCGKITTGFQQCVNGVWSGCNAPTPSESTCTVAVCGSYPAPLCTSGIASSANLDTVAKKYVWTCGNGTSSGQQQCSSPYSGPINGLCGGSTNIQAPYTLQMGFDNLCYTGTASSLSKNADGTYSWYCNGSPASTGVNAGSSVMCANKTASGTSSDIPSPLTTPAAPVATNGVCGGATNVWSPQEPTNNFCSAGTASGTTKNSDGTFSWTCTGVGTGAQTATCQNIYSGR